MKSSAGTSLHKEHGSGRLSLLFQLYHGCTAIWGQHSDLADQFSCTTQIQSTEKKRNTQQQCWAEQYNIFFHRFAFV
jgi:hypothetical protein